MPRPTLATPAAIGAIDHASASRPIKRSPAHWSAPVTASDLSNTPSLPTRASDTSSRWSSAAA